MKPNILSLLTSLFLVPLGAGTAAAMEFHVAPNGSDTNPGTAQRPFATIARARDAARAVTGPNAVILAPGSYFNEAAIVLDDRDSGLTLEGEQPGATADVYGGVPVTGWERWQGNIWRAPVPKGLRFFNLIVDGKAATMAQWPKPGDGYGGGFAPKGSNTTVEVPPEFRACDFSDAQVRAWVGTDWFTEVRETLAPSPDAQGLLKVDPGANRFGMNPHLYVRGVLEFLTEPGEWCLKHNDGFVYYWPKNGAPGDHLIVRAATQRLFDVEGRAPVTPAKDIKIRNLSLIGTDFCEKWYVFTDGMGDAATPGPLQQGMVFGDKVEGLKVSGCRLLDSGMAAVWLNHYAQDCVVENCLIMGAGFAGVYANGFQPGEGPFKSAAESYVNRGHRIEDNFIFDCCKLAGGTGGIQFYQSGDALIARNEISRMPRYGISFKGERWGALNRKMYGHDVTFPTHWDYLHTRNIKVVGNDVHNVCRDSFDYGAIESWGPGRDNLWANNAIHDTDSAVEWSHGLQVLFTDDASHYVTIRDNILYHCEGGSAGGTGSMAVMLKSLGQVFENNFIVDCTLTYGVWACGFIEPAGDTVIRHNLFAGDLLGIPFRIDPERFSAYAGTAGKALPPGTTGIKELDYNIIQPEKPGHGNPLTAKGFETHSFFGDPKVLRAKPDWDITFRDYSVAPDSPALKVGFTPIDTSIIGLRTDFPFDTAAATRRRVTDLIPAEDYDRMRDLHTLGNTCIYNLVPGSWAKYANLDFGTGATKAVFQLKAAAGDDTATPFIRRYGKTVVQAIPFKGDSSVEPITQWEISKPYIDQGKTGSELFDEVFPPETDGTAGEWKPWLAPTGGAGAPGLVDFDAANGGGMANACAYARASIYAPMGRTNATMTISTAGGAKVWLNGALIISANKPGTYSETAKGVIKKGWNTILIKANTDAAPQTAKENGNRNLWFKFGTVTSSCGAVVSLSGLPTEERAGQPLIEMRLDAPTGELIGALPEGQTTCSVTPVTGVHNLFLVFPGNAVQQVDWFKLE